MKMSKGLWRFAARVARKEVSKRFDYSFDDLDLGKLEGPLFIIFNHVCAWDPILIGLAFTDRRLAYVASEHIFRLPRLGGFFNKHVDAIPHKKAGGGARSTIECLRRLKNGESIFIASEGEQSWNGRSKSVVKSTGKLIKKSGAAVVTLNIEGGYLAKPRWADNVRKGRVHLRKINYYSSEDISKMSPEEINETISRDLYFDVWEWQKQAAEEGGMFQYRPHKDGLAEGLERALYICPRCKRIGTLLSRGDDIICECGYKTSIDETGFFNPAEPFETIAEWDEWQEEELASQLDGACERVRLHVESSSQNGVGEEFFGDDDITLSVVEEAHSEREIASGRLALKQDGEDFYIEIGENKASAAQTARFSLSEIESMTMILHNRIVFSAGSMYYEIKPRNMKGRTNLKKYLIAWSKRTGRED